MANRKSSDTSRIVVNNPLLSAASSDFLLENLTKNAVLLPVTHSSPSVLSEDVGEVDSFLGQDTPNSTLPSVIGLPSLPTTTSNSVSSSTLWSTPSRPFNFFSSQQQQQHSPAVSHSSFSQISNHSPSRYSSSSFLSGISASSLPPANQSHLPTNHVPPSSTPVLQVAPVASPSNVSSLFSSSTPSGQWNFQQQFAATSTTAALVTSSNFAALDTTTNTTPVLSLSSSTSTESFASPSAPSPPFDSSVLQSFAPSPLYGKKDVTPPPLASSHHFQPILKPGLQNSSTGPLVAPPIATVAPIAGSTNTYRLGSQKKPLYAQPPGLSFSTPVITSYAPSTIESYSPTPAAVAPPLVQSTTGSMATTQTAAATLTPMQLPSPAPMQYQSPAAAVADSNQNAPTSFTNLGQPMHMYRQVYHHWFYKKEVESKVIWQPFSMTDSLALEEAFTSTDISPETLVATDGGRYDVNILRRQRMAVYWQESPTEVRRCSWFYKGPSDTRYVPYEENISTRLEEEFKIATTTNSWHRRVELPNGEAVQFHGPGVMVHYLQATTPDAWSNAPSLVRTSAVLALSASGLKEGIKQTQVRPRVVKRGVDEFDIDEGEPAKIDHLLFLVHGIGSVCDLKFRTVEEVVDDFRSLSLQLVQSHFHTSQEQGLVNRIEVLPISWHATLHGEDTGIDRKLKAITLKSIPKLRHFTNDTLLDILFYTSPVYCQTIVDTVGKELNRLYSLFCQRNPNFQGGVSLGGHSLGSLILFDLLYHQKPVTEEEPSQLETSASSRESSEELAEEHVGKINPSQHKLNQRVSYVVGNAGTGQPFITYPQLIFQPKTFYALGSPIGMFVTVRGIDTLGEDFCLPTCPGFFNIFHPFDPVAYRIETLVNSELTDLRPVLIPHHKGRKRMHLELKETMARVGADLKQKLVESIRSTWNTVYQLAMFHRTDDQLEEEVDKVLEEQIKQQQETDSSSGTDAEADLDICVGQLNSGRRIDYVLQEAPLESFNEYLFAMKTHVCYWESEDTMLMILKEIYAMMGISADSQVPMQSSSRTPTESAILGGIEELNLNSQSEPQTNTYTLDVQGTAAYLTSPPGMAPPPFSLRTTSVSAVNQQMNLGMDPTAPMSENKNLGPPPISGFVKKS